MQFLNFFYFEVWVNFVFLDPDPQSGSRDPIERGSDPDPDPKHSQKGSDLDYPSGLEWAGSGSATLFYLKYIILTLNAQGLSPAWVKG